MMYERRSLVAALAATTLVASATAAMPPSLGDGFYQGEEIARESECERGRERGWWNDENPITPLLSSPGRATFFGASKQFEDAFSRGKKDAFGDFVSRKRERLGERGRESARVPTRPPPPTSLFSSQLFGSCGYFNKPRSKQKIDFSDLQLPLDGVAALADINPDFPGSCGRCYEVKCKEGILLGNDMRPKPMTDLMYMPAINGSVTDTFGRRFPGNPAEKDNQQYVKCWNNGSSIVRIVDDCPAVLPQGAWANPNKPEPQPWCSSDVYHFDLSYWAFEKQAHPLYGVMNVAFRPVDCDTREPLVLLPGHVSKTIFADEPAAGWSWEPFHPGEQTLMAKGEAHDGGSAACASLQPKGGVTFKCRGCTAPGYQPFNGVGGISFWIKPITNGARNKGEGGARDAAPPPQTPPTPSLLSVASKHNRLALRVALGWPERNQWCSSVGLEDWGATETNGTHRKYDIPMSAFACDDMKQGFNNVDSLVFSNAMPKVGE